MSATSDNRTVAQSRAHTAWGTMLRLLGVAFIITGAAKLFAFGSFTWAITTLLHTRPGLSAGLALVVIAWEMAGGAAFLLTSSIRGASAALAILTGLFLWILYPAALTGQPLFCNCFGILPLRLPLRTEVIVDMILFNVFAFSALLWKTPRSSPAPQNASTLLTTGILLVMIASMEFGLIHTMVNATVAQGQPGAAETLVTFAEHQVPSFASCGDQRRLVLMLRLSEFSCPSCYDDMLALVDSINASPSLHKNERVIALVARESAAHILDPAKLHLWAESARMHFPVIMAPDSGPTADQFWTSRVCVVNEEGAVVYDSVLPIGIEKRETVLRLLDLR